MARKMTGSRWASVAVLALLAGLGVTSAARAADDGAMMPPVGKATISIKVVDGDAKPVVGARVQLFAPVKKVQPTAATGNAAQPMAADDPDVKPPTVAPPTVTPPADGGTKPKRQRPKPLQTATTDAEGAATFKDVADGSYTIRANLKGGGRGNDKVTVTGGKDVMVTVTLKDG